MMIAKRDDTNCHNFDLKGKPHIFEMYSFHHHFGYSDASHIAFAFATRNETQPSHITTIRSSVTSNTSIISIQDSGISQDKQLQYC